MDMECSPSNEILPLKDLEEFYTKPPQRTLTTHENHELLDSNFLKSLCNLRHQYILREMEQKDVLYGLIPWKNTIKSVREHELVSKIDANSVDLYGNDTDVDNFYAAFGTEVRDLQGILWNPFTLRHEVLMDRRLNHVSFSNIVGSRDLGFKSINVNLRKILDSWEFKQFFTFPKPQMSHFQLINQTLCADDSKNIYYIESKLNLERYFIYNVVKRVNSHTGVIEEVLSLFESQYDRITVIEPYKDLLLVGTLKGFLYVKHLKTNTVERKLITSNSNGIINSIRVKGNLILISTNDGSLVTFNPNTLTLEHKVSFPWAINSIAISPKNHHLKLISGDNLNSFIIDDRVSDREPVEILKGHYDYSFSCDWANDGIQLVTSNQDSTVRLFDIRNLHKSEYCLGGEFQSSAIRSVKFNKSGTCLTYNESIDTINIVDMERLKRGEGTKKVIELFGKLTNPVFMDYDIDGSEILTVGVCDHSVGGILQYQFENRDRKCLDFDYL